MFSFQINKGGSHMGAGEAFNCGRVNGGLPNLPMIGGFNCGVNSGVEITMGDGMRVTEDRQSVTVNPVMPMYHTEVRSVEIGDDLRKEMLGHPDKNHLSDQEIARTQLWYLLGGVEPGKHWDSYVKKSVLTLKGIKPGPVAEEMDSITRETDLLIQRMDAMERSQRDIFKALVASPGYQIAYAGLLISHSGLLLNMRIRDLEIKEAMTVASGGSFAKAFAQAIKGDGAEFRVTKTGSMAPYEGGIKAGKLSKAILIGAGEGARLGPISDGNGVGKPQIK